MRETIRQFILENYLYGADPSQLQDEASFLESGIIDSTGVLELVLFLETRFGIKVHDTELLIENLDSVDRICAYLEAKLGGKVVDALATS